MITAADVDVRVARRIADVCADEWDSIVAPDNVQTRHAFIRACEDSGIEDAKYWHVMVYRAGQLSAVATLSLIDIRLDLLSTGLIRSVIGATRRVRPDALRPAVLLCGLPVSAGRPCLAIRDASEAAHVLRVLSDVMAQVAAETGTGVCCVKEFDDAEAATMRGLERHGFFPAASLPSFRMEMRWRTFDEYLASMRAGYRRQVRATLRARDRNRLGIRRVDALEPECARIFALYEQVIDRAEFRLERLNLAFFQNLATYLPRHTGAILVEHEGRLAAAAVLLRTPNVLTFFMAGIDYSLNRVCASYLTLVLEVVAEAIRTDAQVLELGQTSAALKSRLGARPDERHLYFRCASTMGHAVFRSASRILFPPTTPTSRRVFRAHEG